MTVETVEVAIEVEVRYAETDQMGVVHHAVYPVWFEIARTALCLRTGHSYAEIERSGYLLMVTGVHLRYLRPARYGETVHVTCRVARMASRALAFDYTVERGEDGEGGDSEVLVTGTTEHLWVERSTGRPCRIPEALRPGFQGLTGAGDQR
ncbi:MAG: thioesterase family protein [Acidobacteriota bacterium]